MEGAGYFTEWEPAGNKKRDGGQYRLSSFGFDATSLLKRHQEKI